jgi:uncharacterized membrane protein YjfL (UPF0719 family)
MKDFLSNNPPAGVVFYAFLGLVLLLVATFAFEKATPGRLWHQIIEERNVAAAVVLAAMALGISAIIVASIVS